MILRRIQVVDGNGLGFEIAARFVTGWKPLRSDKHSELYFTIGFGLSGLPLAVSG